MSKDISSSSNDLSWLSSSTFLPSVLQMSSVPKSIDTLCFNNIEPWESLTNINQVRRNLNKNWMSKSNLSREMDSGLNTGGIVDNLSLSNSKESYMKEPRIQSSISDNKPINWSCFDSIPSSNELSSKLGYNNFSSSNMKDIWRTQYILNDQCNLQNNPFSVTFDHLNPGNNSSIQNAYVTENKTPERLSLPISPMSSSLSPSTNSGTSPKLNTDLIALMQELAVITNDDDFGKFHSQNPLMTPFQTPPLTPSCTPTKGCVFCKNNSYHSTFYKSHSLKDNNGHCTCPVLRTYVCPLCGGTGDYAHTLKYCPRNTVTKGDPIAAGLPPGKVTNWREVATKMATQHKH